MRTWTTTSFERWSSDCRGAIRAAARSSKRAAILAEGADLESVVKWIVAHDGQPEARAPARSAGGLHGARFTASVDAGRAPARYVLPADALVEPASAPQLAVAQHP